MPFMFSVIDIRSLVGATAYMKGFGGHTIVLVKSHVLAMA